jgi:hypothetical protein
MGKKVMAGALLAAALTFGAPTDARAGCLTDYLQCLEWVSSLEGFWDAYWDPDICDRQFRECLYEELLGW